MVSSVTEETKEQPLVATEHKKRKLTSSSNQKESPILYLNVGGAKRNVRRSIWNALRDASSGGNTSEDDGSGNVYLGNPLCDLVIKGADHWSDVPTTTDDDGTIRIYLDRNPQVFDDLLEYIEYGQVFLKDLTSKNDGGGRLERLKMECDYFTVDTILKDVDEVMFGEAVSFRSDSMFSIVAQCVRNGEGEVAGWDWIGTRGNASIATKDRGGGNYPHGIFTVKTTGTYLMFFSLHSIAATPLKPGQYYTDERFDEFIRMSIVQEELTGNEEGHWNYPLVRCGAFDYRDDREARRNEPLLYTAAFAEPVSLKKGNELYFSHGDGVESVGFNSTHRTVIEHSEFDEEEPHCLNFVTLVRVFGDNISKWSPTARDPDREHSFIKWMPAQNDLPQTPQWAYLDDNDQTKIRFRKAGYYLILGRVASKLKREFNPANSYWGTVRLELRTNGGVPLHIDPEVISFPDDFKDPLPYNKKMAEYGPINDVIYAERDSYISVRATGGACFAQRGTVSSQFGVGNNIPTQSLSAIRLEHDMRVDRYNVSFDHSEGDLSLKRALGGEEGVPDQEPLFDVVERSGFRSSELKALEDCCCIVIGCLSQRMGNTVSLFKNDDVIVQSQVCKGRGQGYGSHTLNAVVEMKANDVFIIEFGVSESESESGGHLAFLKLK